jgi:hypothetical protein
MKKLLIITASVLLYHSAFCWGFYGHKKINTQAVFLLPPQMMVFYKKHIDFLGEHSVDPDKRRYAIAEEGPRHYIDIDHYGPPYNSIPRRWSKAVERYSEDTLNKYGIVPWWVQVMQRRLTEAFREKNAARILKFSAELGHYIADAHVPLHASSNHDGQKTGQKGIHGFWESRIPELMAEAKWDFFIGKAAYISNTQDYIWDRVLESAAAADTVLDLERKLSLQFPTDKKFSFEERNGKVVRQYSLAFATQYDEQLKGMVERRMRQSIYTAASFWYTAWTDAGQPDLSTLAGEELSAEDLSEFEQLNQAWRTGTPLGRRHEEPE